MFGLRKKLFGGDARLFRHDSGGSMGAASQCKMAGLASGLVAGTQVATATGWRPVEAITKGDLVLTFDRGLQPVRSVTRGLHWDRDHACPPALWPLKVPAEALGNSHQMTLLPEQCVMVESDVAEVMFGDPFTLMTAADLAGLRGIAPVETLAELEVIQIQFEGDEVVFVNSGALALCPSLRIINIDELLSARAQTVRYAPLSAADASRLVAAMAGEDGVLPVVANANGKVPGFASCA